MQPIPNSQQHIKYDVCVDYFEQINKLTPDIQSKAKLD